MNISLVIPAFNASQTLDETLESVANQTRLPDEIIVVDDGSTDNTASIAGAHRLKPKVISTKNNGVSSALNLGIREARGDLLCFIDADDLWVPEKTELQLQQLQTDGELHAVFGQSIAFVCPSVPDEVAARLKYVSGIQPGYLLGTVMLRRSWIIKENIFMDPALRTGHFIEWFRQAREHRFKMLMLQPLVLRRRIHPGSLSVRSSISETGLKKDFLEVARRALLAKRRKSPD